MIKKIEDFTKKQPVVLYATAFLFPILIMLCILYTGDFYPFGEKSLFIMDMKGQYVEFFASLRDTICGDNSLFFSWARSMGGNYLGVFAYYIASPLSFLTIFFPIEKMPLAIEFLTLLKFGLCGLSFSVYARYITKKQGREMGLLLLVPTICYVLMSYNMVYSLCLMWLDGVILLPAVLLGVEKILDGKKGLHYMLMLTLLFISNYYTGYMIGIFTALYILYRILSSVTKKDWKTYIPKLLRLALTTFLSTLLSAPLLLGVLKDLMQGKLASDNVNYQPDTVTNFNFFDLFGKYTNGNYDSLTNAGLPAIYCGYVILFLAILFLLFRTVKIREKIGTIAILGILALSFYYTKWDMAWHGFQYPNWFPYRYAFLFSFLLLYMAIQSMCRLAHWEGNNASLKKLMASPTARIIFAIVLIIGVSLEMGENGSNLLAGLDDEFHYGTVEEYETFIKKTNPLVNEIKKKDSGFYRINQGFEYSKNDAMLLGYHGMTHYSSTFNAAINSLTPKLGISQGYFWNSGYGSNAMLDSLFAVKYILADRAVPTDYTKFSGTDMGTTSYQNPMALSIAYGAKPSSLSPDLSDISPFVNQNRFMNAIAGTDTEYFTDCPYSLEQISNTQWNYHFTASSSNPVYLYMKADNANWADVYVNDNWIGNYFSNETNGTLYLGNFTTGQKVTITVISSEQSTSLYFSAIAELQKDRLQTTLNALRNNGMEIETHKGGGLSGSITLAENHTILTSIPYDEGWTVRIDGEPAVMEKFADTFITVQCPAGKHRITFSYISPGVMTGLWICLAALIIALFYFVFWDIGKKKFLKK
ncbi:MAG: YfhO family protein [Lachnospiraceae bacterium]|nr:YfhO family protein [Lachnospiraceae bacterium]